MTSTARVQYIRPYGICTMWQNTETLSCFSSNFTLTVSDVRSGLIAIFENGTEFFVFRMHLNRSYVDNEGR